MTDWLGGIFLLLLLAAAYLGMRRLSRPRVTTAAEFERKAAEGTTMIGASMNALQELLNPEAAKAREVQTQLKEGRYGRKRREGKANAEDDEIGYN